MVVGAQVLPKLDIVPEDVHTRRIRGEEKSETEMITIEAVADNIDRFCTGVLAEMPTTGEEHIQFPPSGALTSVPPGALTSEPPEASGAAGPSGALTASLPSASENVRDVLARGVCGAWLLGMLIELQLSEAVRAPTLPNTRYREALQGRRRHLTSSYFGGCFGSRLVAAPTTDGTSHACAADHQAMQQCNCYLQQHPSCHATQRTRS